MEYFTKLAFVLQKYDIQFTDIYNVDEYSFRIGVIHSSTVITHKNICEASNGTALIYFFMST
jgi:hypothetical protein